MLLAYILVPLGGAALMPILRKIWIKAAAIVAFLVAAFQIGVAGWLGFSGLLMDGELKTEQWLAGQSIYLGLDGLSMIALAAIGLVTLATLAFSFRFSMDEDRKPGFYALILLAVTGMNGLVMATDLFSIYVFLEIVSVCSFILIAYQRDDDGVEGSFKYMMLSAVATIFLLAGLALLFTITGSVRLGDLAAGVSAGGALTRWGLAFIFFALALKAGVMPFHAWLPDAYTSSPAPVSIFLAGIITKTAGVYTLTRLVLDVFGFTKSFSLLLLILGSISVVFGAFFAFGQRDFKRMLAFSSISQIGYIIMGLATGIPLGLVGAVFHFFNHAVFKSLLFMNAGAVEMATGSRNLEEMGGLAERMPVTGVTSVIGLLSTAGIPPLAGFWSKLLIVIALWTAGYHWFAAIAIFASLVTLAYLLVLQRKVFFGKIRAGLEGIREVAPSFYWMAILLATVAVAGGLLFPFFYKDFLGLFMGN